MAHDVFIRPARADEQMMLESLQQRASLSNPGDRDVLLANPDPIALPIGQIEAGCVFVAERDGVVAGFAAVVPRPDGDAELHGLFVEPYLWRRGIGRRLVEYSADIARERAASFLHVIGNPHSEGVLHLVRFPQDGDGRDPIWHRPHHGATAVDDSPRPPRSPWKSKSACLVELNGQNSRAEIQNLREGNSAKDSMATEARTFTVKTAKVLASSCQ